MRSDNQDAGNRKDCWSLHVLFYEFIALDKRHQRPDLK